MQKIASIFRISKTLFEGISRRAIAYVALLVVMGIGLWNDGYGPLQVILLCLIAMLSLAFSGVKREKQTQVKAKAQTDAEVEFATAMFKGIVQQIAEPVCAVNGRGTLIAANSAMEDAFGNIQIGRPFSLSVRAPALIQAVEALRVGAVDLKGEFALPARNQVFRFQASKLAGLSQSGLSLPPFTDDEVILIQLYDLSEALRIDKTRTDFVANASHELRTPLSSLQGFIETLQGPARGDEAVRERFLTIMLQQCQRMSRLIDDLLDLTQIEFGTTPKSNEAVNVAEMLQNVRDALGPVADAANVKIHLHSGIVSDGPIEFNQLSGLAEPVEQRDANPLFVEGNLDEFTRVFQNLIENAIKYGGEGQRVDIYFGHIMAKSYNDRNAFVLVKDYGPGIAAQHVPRIMERFYRVDAEESRKKGGTGLGLSIARHITERHGGELIVRSVVGQGCEFQVRLSAVQAPESLLTKENQERDKEKLLAN